jgi:hypothetical protein
VNIHEDHLLQLNILVTGSLFRSDGLSETKVVKVKIALISLCGLTPEVVSGVSNALTLSNRDEAQDGAKPDGLVQGENTERFRPVSFGGEAREVQTESRSTLYKQ